MELTREQIDKLVKLWFIYGNNGVKHTNMNHGYVQGFIEHNEDREEFYKEGIENMRERGFSEEYIRESAITQECIDAVREIINQNT